MTHGYAETFRITVVGLTCLYVPGAAHAQSEIASVARDITGAAFPGVTVEASSPVLIEKVRAGCDVDRWQLAAHGSQIRDSLTLIDVMAVDGMLFGGKCSCTTTTRHRRKKW